MSEITAEVIVIGDEILLGQTLDTNSGWIGQMLDKHGFRLRYISKIGDDKQTITHTLDQAFNRADLVLITGGLGPTKDDITKITLAEYFNTDLAINTFVLDRLEKYFSERGRVMNTLNKTQALLPISCKVIPNTLGTASGMWFDAKDNKVCVSMPGVPYEMKNMLENELIDLFKAHFKPPYNIHRTVKTIGIAESTLAQQISDWENQLPSHIKLAYLPSPGMVKLRLSSYDTTPEIGEQEIALEIEKLTPLIQNFIFGTDEDEIETVIAQLLIEKKLTLCTAESCTGGYIAHSFTKNAGSSSYFKGSVVAYDNEVKINLLGVDRETIHQHGAVSEEVVKQMSENARLKLNTSIAIATSGIAGPGGGTALKPVGTVWVACSTPFSTKTKKLQLTKDRILNIKLTTTHIMQLIRETLINDPWVTIEK